MWVRDSTNAATYRMLKLLIKPSCLRYPIRSIYPCIRITLPFKLFLIRTSAFCSQSNESIRGNYMHGGLYQSWWCRCSGCVLLDLCFIFIRWWQSCKMEIINQLRVLIVLFLCISWALLFIFNLLFLIECQPDN